MRHPSFSPRVLPGWRGGGFEAPICPLGLRWPSFVTRIACTLYTPRSTKRTFDAWSMRCAPTGSIPF